MDYLSPIRDTNGHAGASGDFQTGRKRFLGSRPANGPSRDQAESQKRGDETASARLAHLAINQEGFVFDPRTGESYVLNAVALAMLHGLQQGLGGEVLTRELADRFDVDEATARIDLGDFVAQLQHFQLL